MPAPPESGPPELSLRSKRKSSGDGRGQHVLLEEEPSVPLYLRFLKAEALAEMSSLSCSVGDEAFGMPGSSDVLLCACHAGAAVSSEELGRLQVAVQRVVHRLQAGSRCFLFIDGICTRSIADVDSSIYARLKYRAVLYADLVVDLTYEEPETPMSALHSSQSSRGRGPEATSPPNTPENVEAVETPASVRGSMGAAESIFGPFSDTDPCSQVYLERFMLMAKAAMLEQVPIEHILISESWAFLDCIRRGARQLSSTQEEDLSEVLVSFRTEAMQRASDPGLLEDSDGVFEQLAAHWQQECTAQQRRFERFAMVCRLDVLHGLSLSTERVSSICEGSRGGPWPALAVVVLPVVFALLLYAVPYDRPDAGYPAEGIGHNLLFVLYCWPVTQLPCWYLFPEWLRMTVFPELRVDLALLWTVGVIVATSFPIATFSAFTGVFPVPFLTVVNISAVVPFLPLLWCCVPWEVRRRTGSGRRLLWSSVGIAMLISIFGMAFPLFNSFLVQLPGVYQNLAIAAFLAARLAFELINKMLARRLGPDMFPLAVALAMYAYEFSMCVMMGGVKQSVTVVMLISADILENAFHVWFIARRRSSNMNREVGSELCIVSVVLLREFVELIVPAQLLVLLPALHFGPAKRFNHLVSGFPDGLSPELQRVLIYLTADLFAEAAVFAATCCLLRAQGLKPLQLLRGVITANLGSYLAIAMACVVFYLQLQHSHFGCDFDFKFPWASHSGSAAWLHGTVWSD